MSGSNIIHVMGAIMLIIIFGGAMALIILKVGGFLDKKSGRITVEDPDTFGQMIMYNTAIAYNCNDQGGGHFGFNPLGGGKAWDDWASLEAQYGFSDLKDSFPGTLSCSGTHVTLPLTNKGIWSSAGQLFGVSSKEWRNDQEGRYSRMQFKINDTVRIPSPACLGADSGRTEDTSDTMIVLGDATTKSWFEWNADMSPASQCWNIFGSGKVTPDDGGGGNKGGAEYSVQVLTLDGYGGMRRGSPSSGWDDTYYRWRFCPGTLGYIQSNNGQPKKWKGHNAASAYSPSNPPGYSNKEQPGHEIDDNTVHTFIVITENGCN